MKTSVKKWICVLSNLIAWIWTRSICQSQATFPGVKFLRISFRFKKRKENSSSYVHVLQKRKIRRFHVVVVQWTYASKKCTKKRDTRAELLFWSLNLLFFWSRRCGRRRSCLSSLITSESTGRWCRPVTSLLLCFNSCKKLNTIFQWQIRKYRLEMSAWYRMALLFSIVIHV